MKENRRSGSGKSGGNLDGMPLGDGRGSYSVFHSFL
jgi:hypothetical protein